MATATEVHDHLRLLFARAGRDGLRRPAAREVARDTPESAAERLLGLPEDSHALVGFPLAVGGTPLRRPVRPAAQARLPRALLAGEDVVTLGGARRARTRRCRRAAARARRPRAPRAEDAHARLTDSLETAFAEGAGQAGVQVVGGPALRFSERFDCARCARAFEEPQPRLFSFNNPCGACPTCHGFGNLIEVDQDLVIPDKARTLAEGRDRALEQAALPRRCARSCSRFARRRGIPMDVAWSDLAEEHRRLVLEGDEEFPGVVGFFRWLETKKYKVQVRVFLSRYRGYQVCPACHGTPAARRRRCAVAGGRPQHRRAVRAVRARARARSSRPGSSRSATEAVVAAACAPSCERRARASWRTWASTT